MASTIIHICVAKRVNEKLQMNEQELFLGAMCPDLSKELKLSKRKSHFFNRNNDNICNVNKFLEKYEKYINKPFEMGYYIHLLTDNYWNKNFIPNFKNDDDVTLLNGISIPVNDKDLIKLLYMDYTNTNISLIKKYDLNLDFFNGKIKIPKTKIKEIPVDKLDILIKKVIHIIDNSKTDKTVLFDIKQIKVFIDQASELIVQDIKNNDKKGKLIKE